MTIHRPSMVIGHSRTGKIIHFQIFYFLCDFLSGRQSYGIVPDAKTTVLDTVPADFVAEAIYTSSCHADLNGAILHLCSGLSHAIKINALTDRLHPLLKTTNPSLARPKKLSAQLLRKCLPVMAFFAPPKLKAKLNNLPLFLDYLKDRQSFDNQHTLARLAEYSVQLPEVDDYLAPVINYYLQRKR